MEESHGRFFFDPSIAICAACANTLEKGHNRMYARHRVKGRNKRKFCRACVGKAKLNTCVNGSPKEQFCAIHYFLSSLNISCQSYQKCF
jgi:hypothetical protein